MTNYSELPGARIHALQRAHRYAIQTAAGAAGLEDLGSPMLLIILRNWGEGREPPTQRDLAQAFHVTPATVAMSLKSLERCGYVEKREDPRDQRCKRVSLTEKGREAVDTCLRVFAQVDEKMLAGFTDAEKEQLAAYHRRMLDNIKGAGLHTECPLERMECECSKL